MSQCTLDKKQLAALVVVLDLARSAAIDPDTCGHDLLLREHAEIQWDAILLLEEIIQR